MFNVTERSGTSGKQTPGQVSHRPQREEQNHHSHRIGLVGRGLWFVIEFGEAEPVVASIPQCLLLFGILQSMVILVAGGFQILSFFSDVVVTSTDLIQTHSCRAASFRSTRTLSCKGSSGEHPYQEGCLSDPPGSSRSSAEAY